jgi:hypothetical protein
MNTLWATLPKNVQDQMIECYQDIEDETDTFAREQLSAMDDDTLRDHLREGIGWEAVDEHDRWVDRPYVIEAFALSADQVMGFMDMAHSLQYAMQAMRERIGQIDQENREWDRVAKDYELNDGAKEIRNTRDLYLARLKQSHDRLAELLLQRDEDVWAEDGDGWLTRAIDTWIRG